jgi:cell division septation protein DedD
MSPDNRDYEEPDEQYELEAPRSIFAALWFRVVLVVAVIGVIAAVAVPYVLEWMNPPATSVTVQPDTPAGAMATAPTPIAPPPPAPAMPAPAKREPPGAAALAPPAAAPTAPQMGARPPAPPAEETRVPAAKSPPKAAAPRAAKAVAKAPAAMGGSYFVQVGAFKDGEQARKLAAKLRDDKFRVAESTAGARGERSAAPAPAGGDKYDVFVAGETVADLSAKLSAKGLSTATTPTGLVVKPSLPLREAVALSKDLATEGLKVQVRRTPTAGAAAAPAVEAAGPPASAPAGPGDGLHRVRVGPFADRAAATEALQALRGKGYRDSFIARAGA